MADVVIKGLRELDQFLAQLPGRIQRNVMRGALRAGMNQVRPAARSNIRNRSGALARGLRVGTKIDGTRVISRLIATGHHRSIAHLVEFGTKPHIIRPRKGKFLYFGGHFFTHINHPGARPAPFMRPALDSRGSAGVAAMANYIKNRLQTRHGLEVGHVKIEADE